MGKLVIFGATSLARLAHYYATEELCMNVVGFVVDDEYHSEPTFNDLPLFKWSDFISTFSADEVLLFVAIGYRNIRLRSVAYEKVKSYGYKMTNLISVNSHVSKKVSLGDNNFIMPGVVIEPFVEAKSNNVFWSNVTVCHDTKIGNHNFFGSNTTIGGEVIIGSHNFFGFSVSIIHRLVIENDILVGAGSLVLNHLESLSQYQGSPAIKVKDIDRFKGVMVK